MEVKKGFKNTEVGFIPNDWEVEFVKNIAQIKTGSRNTQDRIENGLYPFYVRSQTVERINSYSYDGEAVLTAGDGVGVGKVIHYVNEKFDCHQRVYRISDFKSNINGFYFYLYFSNNFYNRIMQMTAKSSVDSVRMEMIADMQIPLPPTLKEQTAIANVLSDTDTWINSLEQLLTKKRQIKQGAMQELLQPKDGWEVKKLGEITMKDGLIRGPFGGALKKEFFTNNGFKVYEQKNAIYKNVLLGKYYINYSKFNELKRFEVKENDFILSCSGTIGKIYRIPNKFQKGIINQALLIIRLDTKLVDLQYFNHIFQFDKIQNKIIDDTQGGAMKNLVGMSEFRKVEIPLPRIEEQTRIATILSDMDDEIAQLETKLAKAKQIKQGMMQELLTGRIRLV